MWALLVTYSMDTAANSGLGLATCICLVLHFVWAWKVLVPRAY